MPCGSSCCFCCHSRRCSSKRGRSRARQIICRGYAVHMWRCLQVSRDEEKLQKARLEIKRGLPLQDLANNRGFPDSPRMQPQVALPPCQVTHE